MIDFKKLEKIITQNQKFLLTTHVNPDADAIGSQVAFYQMLKKLDKESRLINHSATPYNLEFLDVDNKIEKFDEEIHKQVFNEVDVIVALDFNRSGRMVSMEKGFLGSTKLKICIDHHTDPENVFDHIFDDINYSATSHILYDFLKQTGITEIDLSIADPVYAGIMTDTGSFRFERTDSELHKITAELLNFGVNPQEVYDKIYDQSKFSKAKLLGKALESLQLFGPEKEIAYMVLTQENFRQLDAIESDTDTFVNYCLSIEKVRIGIMFIELKDGFKVSFRSKGNIPVNKLAAEFGGGGHLNASGARLFHKRMNDYITEILNHANNYL
jgi:phosphoesterase RecJ-like protein